MSACNMEDHFSTVYYCAWDIWGGTIIVSLMLSTVCRRAKPLNYDFILSLCLLLYLCNSKQR